MNRIRKFSRGSGRVLGFIFAASVIWLIFDMAALKLSFSEVNSKLLKEELIRGERGRFKGWQGKLSVGPFHRREGRPAAPGESIHDRFKDRVRDPMQDPFHRREERPTILIETNPARFRDRLRDRLHRNKPFKPLDNAEKETNRSNESPKPSFNKTLIPGRAVGKLLESKAPPSSYMHSNGVRRIPGIFINATGLLRTKHTGVKGPQHTPLATESRPTVKLAAPTSAAQKKGATENVDGPVIAYPEKRAADSQRILLSSLPPAELKRKQDMPSKSSVLQTMPPAPGTAQPAEPERGHIVLVDKIQSSEGKGGRELTVLVAGVAAITPEKHDLNSTANKAAIDGNKESANKFSSETHVGPAIERIENVTDTSIEHFQTMLRSKERQVSNNKPQDTHNANMVTRKANLSNLYEHNANQAVERGKVNGNDSQQSHKVNQQDVGNALALPARDMGMHKVLTIDVTVSPRDPQAIGQFGRRAEVPTGKEEEAKRRWKEGHFNVYLSDLIPIDRAIDDTRPLGCSEQLVHNDLPTTSVIMCFVDEVWSTLLRSVLSVLNRSPPHLIKEIILVDDFSSKEYLKDNLDRYMSQFPKVRILHLKERYGLIRARLAGANIATGDVLTFLDSHVECNVGWLEPLLESVYLNRRKVACPVIEVVSDKDMSYNTVDNFQRGIFSWPMNFGWKQIPPEEIKKNKIKETDPIRCPVMAGGLFSIDKTYFFELGTYDPGLDVWGGENMELSFKVWMCGGEIEIIPCSRVGHIFRDDNPYSFPKDRMKTVERNLARVAEVWLDEYKELFYGHGYHLNLKHFDVGDLTQQIALRKSLQCRSFKWYLDNVYPDLVAPVVRASGVFKNVGLGKCLSIQNSTVFFDACSAINQNQQFNYTWMRLIKQGDVCLTPMHRNEKLGLHHCDNASNSNKWLHKSLVTFEPLLNDHIVLDYIQPPACLEVDHTHKVLRINTCDSLNHYQKWHFGQYFVD